MRTFITAGLTCQILTVLTLNIREARRYELTELGDDTEQGIKSDAFLRGGVPKAVARDLGKYPKKSQVVTFSASLQPKSTVITTITHAPAPDTPDVPLMPISKTTATGSTTLVLQSRIDSKGGANNYEDAKFCHGSSLTTREIAGTCMDGNFLLWSGESCDRYCSCDESGNLHCSHPSDCGPDDVVNDYCRANKNFQCDCLVASEDNWKIKEALGTRKQAVDSPPFNTVYLDLLEAQGTRVQTIGFPPSSHRDVNAQEVQGTRTQTVGFPPLGRRIVPESSTTLYGIVTDHNGQSVVPAAVVPATSVAEVDSFYSQYSVSRITPTTLYIGTELVGTRTDLVGPTDQTETDYAAQTTTIYGVAVDGGGLEFPAVIVPNSRASSVLSIYTNLTITQVTPITSPVSSVYTPIASVPLIAPTYVIPVDGGVARPTLRPSQQASNNYPEEPTSTKVVHLATVIVTYIPTTFATMAAYSPKDFVAATLNHDNGNDFDFVCEGANKLKTILAPLCPATNLAIYLNGYYCEAHCTCNNDGCVTCDAQGSPSGIDDCGGNDEATAFCREKHGDYLECFCKNKHGARSGC